MLRPLRRIRKAKFCDYYFQFYCESFLLQLINIDLISFLNRYLFTLSCLLTLSELCFNYGNGVRYQRVPRVIMHVIVDGEF